MTAPDEELPASSYPSRSLSGALSASGQRQTTWPELIPSLFLGLKVLCLWSQV